MLLPDLLILFLATSGQPGLDDAALYEKIKQGDQHAFKKFFDQHYDVLYTFLMSRSTSPDIAEDLIQKAFIYIWENRESIKPDLSLRAYLFRIAYTRMLNHIKASSKFSDSEPEIEENSEPSPEQAAYYSDLNQALEQTVQQMPEKRRLVFTNCFINEYTYKETAEILDVSVKTIENHMALALRDVRSALYHFKDSEKNQEFD